MSEQAIDGFSRRLRRWARKLLLERAVRAALWGATAGALLAAALSALLWALRVDFRKSALLAILLGAAVGVALSLRRRWTLGEVALFLDARLKSAEAVTSAWALLGHSATAADATGPGPSVQARAEAVLSSAEPRQLRLAVWSRWHALALPALALSVWLTRIPLPKASHAAKPAPGTELLRRGSVAGLERIEALEAAPSLSSSDAERLKQLAEEARKLRADLARGLEKREAQARIATLRDGVAAERQRFGDKSERAGLESALAALEGERVTERAGKALGDGDIVAFDEEMQRLANQAESHARDAAKQALDEAARAARAKGAEKLADMLDRQRGTFAKREAKMQALRELAKSLQGKLDPNAREELSDLNETGNPEAARKLSEALADALDGLSEDERKQLSEALKKRLSGGNSKLSTLSREELSRLARDLSTKKGREQLKEMLRELAQGESPDSKREQALDDAERGGMEAERGLGSTPLPLPGAATPSPGQGSSPGPNHEKAGEGDPGGSRGGDRGKHDGSLPPVAANELRARAGARWLPGAPLAARSLGRAPGRAGETANQVGTGNLSSRAGGEVGAVEGADIPEEYRAHVGRYFEP
jgi:hypothetical protein